MSVISNSVWPHRQQPTRLWYPWDSPGKNTGVGCHFLLQCAKVKSLSRVWLLATPWTAAYQAPPPMGFSKQEYWSRVALPSPSLPMSHLESPIHVYIQAKSAESCFPFHSVEWKSWKPRKEKFLSKQSVIRKFDPSLLFRNLVFVL